MDERPVTILQVLPRLGTGGAERVVIEIAQAVTNSGNIALIACDGGALSNAALRAGAEIIPMKLATKSPYGMRCNARRLQKLIKERNVTLIHAHSRAPAWSAYWAAGRTNIPFVTTYHGSYSENSALKRRYNAVMAKGDRVVAVSSYIADLVRARYGVGQDRLRVIPGGVDPAKFDPLNVLGDRVARLAKAWRLEVGTPSILLPGRLTSWKGQEVLINALALMRHQDTVAVLVGDAQGRKKYVANLMALVKKLGLSQRVRLAGHTDDMPAAMMLADVMVNASIDPEAFGRTIIEAQAMGRIVVAADHGGARETIIAGKTAFLFPPGDAAALAAAIDFALDMSSDERIAWGQAARTHITQHYAVSAMQQAMLEVYAELLM